MPFRASKEPLKYQAITRENVHRFPFWDRLDHELQEAIRVVSTVFPFRTNNYVVENLIDWDAVPDDPIYQLTFPQAGMLLPEDYRRMAELVRRGASGPELQRAANEIRLRLNPHPAGQLTHNRPYWNGRRLEGIQHKYVETVLFFPSQGQTCHAYCTFCFRWAQFIGIKELQMASSEVADLVEYLKQHPRVSDVLITGGDPMVMRAGVLRRYIEPLLSPELEHVSTIRIGTKAVAYWPQRFVTDPDADEILRLFERVVASGKHLAVMAHYNHPVELSPPIAQEAVRRIRATGANIRVQAPVVRHVNDNPDVWAELWRVVVRLGAIPYYMFVERDTGARHYFELPLWRVWEIYRGAYKQVSGLARSVRGPCMSAFQGKVRLLGITRIYARTVFILEYLQARQPDLVRIPFFAKFDPYATWFDQLEPAFEHDRPFFEEEPETVRARLLELTG